MGLFPRPGMASRSWLSTQSSAVGMALAWRCAMRRYLAGSQPQVTRSIQPSPLTISSMAWSSGAAELGGYAITSAHAVSSASAGAVLLKKATPDAWRFERGGSLARAPP